ncbi:MAG: hypothetical protein H6555_06255 [Lewinellaceae bacterium]|nr:hypothetical protein [Lewinellaceae bacterium]
MALPTPFPKTKRELATLLHCSYSTMKRRLQELPFTVPRGHLSRAMVRRILIALEEDEHFPELFAGPATESKHS